MLTAMALAGLVASCATSAPDPDATPIRIVVVQPGEVPDALELVSPTPLGVELAIDRAVADGEVPPGSGIEVLDLSGSAEADAEAAARLAADPAVVAAFLTPFTDAPSVVGALVDAGVPVLSLSGNGPTLGGSGWLRLVPSTRTEAATLADVARPPACVTGTIETTTALAEALASDPESPRTLPLDQAAAQAAGCSDVIWLGDTDGAAELRRALDAEGRGDIGIVVSLAARSERLASEGFPAMVGTRAVSPCADLLTSADTDAQRFIHAYQAAHGIPPGPCAVEAFAAAAVILRDEGRAPTREGVTDALAGLRRLRTPAGAIVVGSEAERQSPGPSVEAIVGVRWLPSAAP